MNEIDLLPVFALVWLVSVAVGDTPAWFRRIWFYLTCISSLVTMINMISAWYMWSQIQAECQPWPCTSSCTRDSSGNSYLVTDWNTWCDQGPGSSKMLPFARDSMENGALKLIPPSFTLSNESTQCHDGTRYSDTAHIPEGNDHDYMRACMHIDGICVQTTTTICKGESDLCLTNFTKCAEVGLGNFMDQQINQVECINRLDNLGECVTREIITADKRDYCPRFLSTYAGPTWPRCEMGWLAFY